MNAYLIAGLGADERVFKKMVLPSHYAMHHLTWIKPQPKDSLASYAQRLAERIDRSTPFVLIGLSMGGMIAAEIADKLSPKFTVLISSTPTSAGLPPWFKVAHRLQLYKLLNPAMIKSGAIIKRVFSNETPEDKNLIREMIEDIDADFIRWAVQAIVEWEKEDTLTNYIHIHGSHDEILPMRFTKPTHIIRGGTHLAILTHHQFINETLAKALPTDSAYVQK